MAKLPASLFHLFIALLSISLASFSLAQAPGTVAQAWLFPPSAGQPGQPFPQYSISDTLNASFTSPNNDPRVATQCLTENGQVKLIGVANAVASGPSTFTILLGLTNIQLNDSGPCWLNIANTGVDSSKFQVLRQTRPGTTIGPGSPTTSTSSPPAPETQTVVVQTPGPSSPPQPALTTGAIAGISVAIGVVVIAIVACLILVKKGRLRVEFGPKKLDGGMQDDQQLVKEERSTPAPPYRWAPLGEMVADRPPVELATGRYQ